MVEEFKVSPPWVTYARKLEAIFERDPAVAVGYDNDGPEVTVLVDGQDKADSIARLLPTEVEFGGVTLKVKVVPSNDESPEAVVRKAFVGNAAVADIRTVGDGVPFLGGKTYVMFRPEVVQFFDDDLQDYNGLHTTIYQDIARELFDAGANVSFCTDVMLEFPNGSC